jgi:hypothetical protein
MPEGFGRYFNEDQFIESDWYPPGNEVTIIFWANWVVGDGPLVKTADENFGFPIDREGTCGYRIGGEQRDAELETSALRDRWAFYALAMDSDEAMLWLDGGAVNTWNPRPSANLTGNLILMQDATGFAAHFAVFEHRLSRDELGGLWSAGKEIAG